MEPNPANRALGYGLLAGAGGLAVLGLVWLLVGGVQAGGFVLGLILLFVLVGPLAGAGWYLLSRQRVEAMEEAAFAGKRRILEADRVFRRELAAELRQLAGRPGLPASSLEQMAEDLERRAYDTPQWYDIVHLENSDATTLRQYDDLVWERVQWLRGHAERADAAGTSAALRELEEALDQRRDLLMRGKRAPVAAPSELLRAGSPARGVEALVNLRVHDAVSHDGEDFVAEGVATYFAEGQNWKLVHLTPSGPGAGERWLYVAPAGLVVALLKERAGTQPGAETATVGGAHLPLTDSGTATVDVVSKAGSARGVLVEYWSYRAGDRFAYTERWPDGAVHAYGGQVVHATDLEVWPSAVQDAGTR